MKYKIFTLLCLTLLFTTCSLLQYDLVSPIDEHTSNGLSVFYIHPKPVSKDYYTPATVIYRGETYQVEAKIRGGVTALYPKKSYTLKFPDDHLFSDINIDPVNGDFTNRKKLVLISNFDDNSYLRNRLAYFMWNQMDNNFKIHSFSSEVYTNGAFEGLYTVTDFIDETFIERNSFSTDGQLFKGSTADVDFKMKSNLLSGFEKKMGSPIAGEEGAYDALEDFILLINNTSDADFSTEFANAADAQEYYNWWFYISFMKGWDSAGKNSYHYFDSSTGGKWHYIPWDFNQSFGQSWDTKRLIPEFNPTDVGQNAIFKRLINDPIFKSNAAPLYSTLLSGKLTKANLLNEVDRLNTEINASAKRDFSKWKKKYKNFRLWDGRSDFTSVDEEISYIKNWITDQHDLFLAEYP